MRKMFFWSIIMLAAFNLNAQGDIYLSIPTDGEVIEDKSVHFLWQASSLGSAENPRISQELIVSEIKWDQTPYESIEVNSPILNKSSILGSSFYVSSSNFPFEEGKKYAWQVRYYMDGVPISKSEVWWFELKTPEEQPREFVPVRLKSDGQVMSAIEDKLYLSLLTNKEINLMATIVNEFGERTQVEFKEIVANEELEDGARSGMNESRNFILDLEDLDLEKGVYTLRWRTSKESDYTVLFKIL